MHQTRASCPQTEWNDGTWVVHPCLPDLSHKPVMVWPDVSWERPEQTRTGPNLLRTGMDRPSAIVPRGAWAGWTCLVPFFFLQSGKCLHTWKLCIKVVQKGEKRTIKPLLIFHLCGSSGTSGRCASAVLTERTGFLRPTEALCQNFSILFIDSSETGTQAQRGGHRDRRQLEPDFIFFSQSKIIRVSTWRGYRISLNCQ